MNEGTTRPRVGVERRSRLEAAADARNQSSGVTGSVGLMSTKAVCGISPHVVEATHLGNALADLLRKSAMQVIGE